MAQTKSHIRIKKVAISWTTKGTYKNLSKEINNLLSNEELLQVENSITHIHIVIREYNKKIQQYEFKVYEEPISFTMKGTYKNLLSIIDNMPKGEEFFQITSTPTHLHLITRKKKHKNKV